MTPIRIALAGLRPRLCDIITDAVASEADIEIVAPPPHLGAPARRAVEVLIVGTEEPDDETLPGRLLANSPHAVVLMIGVNEGVATLYELRPSKKPLGDVTAASLVAAIRTIARERAGSLSEL